MYVYIILYNIMIIRVCMCTSFPGGSVVKDLPANAGDARDVGLIPGLERSPWEGHGNPFQYSCLENLMEKGAWLAIVHMVTKSQT